MTPTNFKSVQSSCDLDFHGTPPQAMTSSRPRETNGAPLSLAVESGCSNFQSRRPSREDKVATLLQISMFWIRSTLSGRVTKRTKFNATIGWHLVLFSNQATTCGLHRSWRLTCITTCITGGGSRESKFEWPLRKPSECVLLFFWDDWRRGICENFLRGNFWRGSAFYLATK